MSSIIKEMLSKQEKESGNALDDVRKEYIKKLSEYTGRNTITYYSAYLKDDGNGIKGAEINSNDKNLFMSAVYGLDYSKGLDLILHTPGGAVTAAESIMHYLNNIFEGDIRVIIPFAAFSAGSIIACGGKSIVMGKQSNIGPFDPWLGSISCHNLLEEFEYASKEMENKPHRREVWLPIINKIQPTLLTRCKHSIAMASSIVETWLKKNMLKEKSEEEQNKIVSEVNSKLNNPEYTREHSRHIHSDQAKEMGLIIEDLEGDQEFQDLVLSIHHSNMILFGQSSIAKVVENNMGETVVANVL